MRVINRNGTAGKDCNCGSWKAHWVNCSRKPFPKTCRSHGCTNIAEVGAHVLKHNSRDQKTYIVPFCRTCNGYNSDVVFELNAGTTLVWANKQKTCS